jgi:NitT/TauT family transport system substrate-binding protein
MRRSLFLASAATTVAVPNTAFGQAMMKVRLGSTASQDVIGALYGIAGGVFRKYGLDVEHAPMSGGAAIMAALLGGSLEIAKVAIFDIIRAHAKGVPIVMEGAAEIYHAEDPDAALVVAKNSPYKKAADLNGKTLSSPGLRDFFAIADMAWIDANGGDSRTAKFIELPGAATVAAIGAGRIDAASVAKPILTDAIQSGTCRILGYSMSVFGKQFCATGYVTTTAYAQQNPDVLARFRSGLVEASGYANVHTAEMIPIIAQLTGLEPQTIAAMPPTRIGAVAELRSAPMFQPIIDQAVKYNVIPTRFPFTEMMDPRALS